MIATVTKSATFEGLEEVASNWGNRVLDVLAYGDKNAISQTYQNFRQNGYNEGDATFQTFATLVGEDLQTFAISAFSGGFVSGADYLGKAMSVGGIKNYKKMYDEQYGGQGKKVEQEFKEDSGIKLEKDFEDYPYNEQTVLENYVNSVNDDILTTVNEIKTNSKAPFKRINLSSVSEKAVSKIKELTGIDVSGYIYAINTNAIRHISNRHGENGQHDRSMAKAEDVANLAKVTKEIAVLQQN